MAISLSPCFWYESDAYGAMQLYANAFENSVAPRHNDFMSSIQIKDQVIHGLNGGPMFKPNPTLSLYTTFTQEAELRRAYEVLVKGGKTLMALDTYDWSPLYVWVEDKYGVSWQLILNEQEEVKISPAVMFVGTHHGKAQEALQYYIDTFEESKALFTFPYSEGPDKGLVAHGQFELCGNRYIVMDSGAMHEFSLSEGTSIIMMCDNQEEIDHYYDTFAAEGAERQCGWCKDKYGLSWQIVQRQLTAWMSNPETVQRVAQAFLPMKKINLSSLEAAAKG